MAVAGTLLIDSKIAPATAEFFHNSLQLMITKNPPEIITTRARRLSSSGGDSVSVLTTRRSIHHRAMTWRIIVLPDWHIDVARLLISDDRSGDHATG